MAQIISTLKGHVSITDADLTNSANVGLKAHGLECIPPAWRPAYFVIANEFYSEWKNATEKKKGSVVNGWLPCIQSCLRELSEDSDNEIIVRSSGLDEGMDERGQYTSETGPSSCIQSILNKILRELQEDRRTGNRNVAFIVQLYIRPLAKGHLSNERRCYEERRDWLGEIEASPPLPAHQFVVNIRNWRDQPRDSPSLKSLGNLECHHRVMLPKAMKAVARFFYMVPKKRFHLEWVWDGSRVYVVQADEAIERFGNDPTTVQKRHKSLSSQSTLKILKPLNDEFAGIYSKVKNVYVYRSLGLATTSLFVLDDQSMLNDLANGKINEDLVSDLRSLLNAPLVIRTDVQESDQAKKQFLKRSDELRTVESAINWLCDAARELQRSDVARSSPVFIFHNFLPAVSSAFIYAAPNQRLVQITGLWGLPEGLYYNSHDQFLIDTINTKHLDSRPDFVKNFRIQRKLHYKKFFVCPNDDGKWERQIVAPPHDWRSSIWKDDWLRQMAIDSRRIAEAEGQALSIMWFVGVQGKITTTGIMPWFHEPFDTKLFEKTTVSARKKNVWETSFQINTEADVRSLEKVAKSADSCRLKRIQVNPTEDALLRNRKALEQVGNLAVSIGATIVLEGAVLSHAYYQLVATGATVEVIHPFIEFQEKQEFNKLVRDKIPEVIQGGGERVLSARVDRETILDALRAKLVEEAVETKDAQDADQIVEELADVEEVLCSILDSIGKDREELERVRLRKKEKRGGFSKGLVLLETNQDIPSEPVKQGDIWLDGLAEAGNVVIPVISAKHYTELVNRVDHWQDVRLAPLERQALLTLEVPILRDNWHFSSKPLKSNEGNWVATGDVTGIRKNAKLRIELVIKLSKLDVELFDKLGEKEAP